METEQIIARVRQTVYVEVRKQYRKDDLNDRIRDVLYERSEKYQQFISRIRRKSDTKLLDERKFDRFMATKGADIVREVVDLLNNKPKMLAKDYETEILRQLEKDVNSGLHANEFERSGVLEQFLEENECYQAMKGRLKNEQDSDGYVYSDHFHSDLNRDFAEILNEIYETIMFREYERNQG